VAGALVTGDQWLSLPVGPADWRGSGRLRTLIVSIGLPDGAAPSDADPRANDHRRLAVFFSDFSVSASARGQLVVAAGEPTR